MNWDDVRMFLAVARTGQILAASKRLGLNHATLSRRVTSLEETLKTRLLVRRPNGCELTAEGEIFLAAAERMETEMLAAQSQIGRIDTAIAGTGTHRRAGWIWCLLPRAAPRAADGALSGTEAAARAGAPLLLAVAA